MDYSLFLVKLTLNKQEAEDVFGKNIKEKQNKDFIELITEEDNNNYNNKLQKNYTYKGKGIIHDVQHYRQYLFPSLTQGTAYIISIIDYFQIFNFFKYVESGLKTNFFRKKKKKIISCVDPITYSNRFIQYIVSLTDVKQFLSNEIKEASKDDENSIDDETFDDDSDDENFLFKKKKKKNIPFSLKEQNKNSSLLLPLEEKIEIQASYVDPKSDLKF